MSKQKQFALGYYTGKGATTAQAREAALELVRDDCRGDWTPVYFTAGAYSAIMWREPGCGWRDCMLHVDGAHVVRPQGGATYGDSSRENVERSVRRHLGQCATDWRTCQTVDHVHPIIVNASDRAEILSWARWQRSYASLKAQGLSDHEAHLHASSAAA